MRDLQHTKVAQIRDQVVQSPIDKWSQQVSLDGSTESSGSHPSAPRRTREASQSPQPPPVGALKIHFQQIEGTTAARVTLEVVNDKFGSVGRSQSSSSLSELEQRVFLTGILVQRNELNWVQLTMPDIAQWQQPMLRLSDAMVQRIYSPEFFETLRAQICQRFLTLF